MRRLLYRQQGSVSVFLIMMVAIIFMFVAVFIDYARITAFQLQTEQLAKSGIRSVMSSYEPALQEKYGLFALGGSDSNELLASSVAESTGIRSRKGEAFRLLDTTLDSQSVNGSSELGRYPVFERQILEEMKYKAPIDFTLEIVNRFKPLSLVMKEASKTTDLLVKLQKLYEKREKLVDRIMEAQKKASQLVERTHFDTNYVFSNGQTSLTDSSLGSIHSAADIAAQYADYVRKNYADSNRDPDEDAQYAEETSDYEREAGWFSSSFAREATQIQQKHRKHLEEVKPLFGEVREINDQMKGIIAEAEQQNNADYDQVGQGRTPASGVPNLKGDSNHAIQDIRNTVQQLVMPDDFVNSFEAEVQGQLDSFQRFEGEVGSFRSVVSSSIPSTSGSSGPLKQSVTQMKRKIDDYLQAYVWSDAANIILARQQAIATNRSSDKERKRTEAKSKAKLSEVLGLLDKLKQTAKESQQEFDQLEGFFDDSITFNAQKDREADTVSIEGQPEDAGKQSMSMMDGLYGGMAGMLEGVRDEFYRNEYAVNHFTRFEPAMLKSLFTSHDVDKQLSNALHVKNQELEYILYGFHLPGGNVSAAYGEIFSTRLAIRTMEGFVECSRMGHPLLILASAILYGIEHALQDMLELVNKGDLELSKYVPLRLTYKDHLRMFLMLHSRNEKMMSRMLALIQFNTGINPNEKLTYMEGDVRASIHVWFLPGVMRSLRDVQMISQGEFEGNRYYVTKKAAFSY
ncbi:hypothetical protein BVG16_17445 [Paenibacillus selenitireducens]|uniref:Uncharacterized protein n=1 Tax=Paenibacillus selenitireducens TaxID=1324314 RepID=A0A1T2XAT5_9BACL|nr:hypothetical protein BVG16_17445 [Paenibacillus selenitireducens]